MNCEDEGPGLRAGARYVAEKKRNFVETEFIFTATILDIAIVRRPSLPLSCACA